MTRTTVRLTAAVAAAAVLIVPVAASAVPPPKDVIVRNTTTDPVFTEIVGTPSVKLSGTQTVAVDPPALVQHHTRIIIPAGDPAANETLLTVPAGKEFRLSFVTASLTFDSSKGVLIRLRNGVGPEAFDLALPLERHESAIGGDGIFDYSLSTPVSLIWGSEEIVNVVANRADDTFTRTVHVALVGQLVDAAS